MKTVDPLADWWRHQVTIAPLIGHGAYGPVHGEPEDHLARISGKARQVRDKDGTEVLSTVTVTLPITAGHVPTGSTVTLPATHGGREATVIATAVSDGGGLPTPDHVSLHLE